VRRLVILAGVLALPVLVPAPASAVDHVICVVPAVGGCDETFATIQLAAAEADNNSLDDTIRLGAANYSNGPYQIAGGAHAVTLEGAGEGSTFITLADSAVPQTYLTLNDATVQGLTITLTGGANSSGDHGLNLTHATADHVTVNAAGTENAIGIEAGDSTVTHSAALAPPEALPGVRGFFSSGGNTVTDSTIVGSPGFDLSDPNTIDNLSRVTIRTDTFGVLTDGGAVNIDDSVIDLGTEPGAVGLGAVNFNNGTATKTISGNHVTIVGGGAGSRGAWAYAAATGALTTSTVTLTNSIVRGPETSLVADASNDGAQGGPSTATVNVSFTDFKNKGGTIAPVTGAGGVVEGVGNLVDVDPGFVSGSDRHLTPGSAVVDQGDPAVGGPALDLDGHPRVQDGDTNGSAVRDMGAYELGDVTPPETTINSGPSGPTSDSTPTFTFSSNELSSSFECQIGGADTVCTSPFTVPSLADGAHTLTVTATDAAGNLDASPATRTFTVDTVLPDTSITSGPTGLIGDTTPTFGFSSEAGATFECKVDGAAYAACTSLFTTSALSNGAHTFSVRAKDAATNLDATPAARAFTVDATAPDTTVTKQPARKSGKKKAKFRFTSNEAGATFECSVDGTAYAPCSSPLKLKVKVGKHVVLIRAIDAVGNVDATPARVKFTRLKR
jgi:hypothetical protein